MSTLTAIALAAYATKTFIIIVFLIVAYRFLGKRSAGTLTVYDLVAIVAVANAVQNTMTGGHGQIWVGLTTSTVIIITTWLLIRFRIHWPGLERVALGSPTILIHNGTVLVDRLRRQRLTPEQLDAVIRSHGLETAQDVKLGVLEIDGSVSIIPKHRDSE